MGTLTSGAGVGPACEKKAMISVTQTASSITSMSDFSYASGLVLNQFVYHAALKEATHSDSQLPSVVDGQGQSDTPGQRTIAW
jgi:hypothetical protein